MVRHNRYSRYHANTFSKARTFAFAQPHPQLFQQLQPPRAPPSNVPSTSLYHHRRTHALGTHHVNDDLLQQTAKRNLEKGNICHKQSSCVPSENWDQLADLRLRWGKIMKDVHRFSHVFSALDEHLPNRPNPWHVGSSHRLRYGRRWRRLNCLSGQRLLVTSWCEQLRLQTGVWIMRITTKKQVHVGFSKEQLVHVNTGSTSLCASNIMPPSIFCPSSCFAAVIQTRITTGATQSMFKQRYTPYKHHEQNKSPNTQFWFLCFKIVVNAPTAARVTTIIPEQRPICCIHLFARHWQHLLNIANWPSPSVSCALPAQRGKAVQSNVRGRGQWAFPYVLSLTLQQVSVYGDAYRHSKHSVSHFIGVYLLWFN